MGTSSFLERKLGKELYVAERGAEPPLRPVGTGNFVSAIFSFPASAFLKESWAKNFTRLRRARELIVRTGAAFSRRPVARIAWGATPAHVR